MARIDEALAEVVLGVGEELAMLLPMMPMEDAGEEAPAVPADAARVRVTFQGPWFGELVLGFGGQVPAALAANMLGAEENPEPELVRDACAEFANVVCGNLLPRLAGKGPVFTLGAPEAAPSMALFEGFTPCGGARIEFDEGPIEVVLGLDEVGLGELGLDADGRDASGAAGHGGGAGTPPP